MRLAAFLLLACVACADPVVEMQLVLPKTDVMNTSCISAVEVHANGATYPATKEDTVKQCIEIAAGSTYASVRDAIHDKFSLQLPDTGLASLEIFGWSGTAPCKDDMDPYTTPDLLFYGNADYIGQDQIQLPLTPNLDCSRSNVRVRLVDMFALIGGATCAVASTVPDDGTAGAGLGTLVPRAYGKGVEFFGNQEGANSLANIATFEGYTKVGSRSCLAIDGGSNSGGSTSCVIGGTPVCAGAGEIEQASLSNPIIVTASNWDTALLAKFPGVTIGSVWSSGATKTPISGATVEVDPAHGKIVYVDAPATGTTTLKVRTDAFTGPSGLFILYSDTLATVTVKANGASRTVQLGATTDLKAGALITVP